MFNKTLLIAAAIAGTFAAAMPAGAQSYQQPGAQSASTTESVLVRPAAPLKRFNMPRSEIQQVKGEYAMEDGTRARIDARQRNLVVDFDNRTTVLQPVGAFVFANERDDMTLVYTKDSLGDDMIVVSYIPQASVAAGLPVRVRLSSR